MDYGIMRLNDLNEFIWDYNGLKGFIWMFFLELDGFRRNSMDPYVSVRIAMELYGIVRN